MSLHLVEVWFGIIERSRRPCLYGPWSRTVIREPHPLVGMPKDSHDHARMHI